MATRKFKCKVCGYVHTGDSAPEKCPVCQVSGSEFEEIVEPSQAAPKKKEVVEEDNDDLDIDDLFSVFKK